MKRVFIGILLLAATTAGSCSKGADSTEEQGPGQVVFNLATTGEIASTGGQTSRAATRQLPANVVPDAEDFRLTLHATDGSMEMTYKSLAAYDQPLLSGGDYSVQFTSGIPTAEGPGASYFECSDSFTIIARKTIAIPFTAQLANTALSLATTKWFNDYYASATLTLRTDTANGYKETFIINQGEGQLAQGEVPAFVCPGAKIYLSGKAKKTNGVEVTFPETEIGSVKARTWHTVVVDMSSSTQLSLQVVLDDKMTEIKEEIELNPEA